MKGKTVSCGENFSVMDWNWTMSRAVEEALVSLRTLLVSSPHAHLVITSMSPPAHI